LFVLVDVDSFKGTNSKNEFKQIINKCKNFLVNGFDMFEKFILLVMLQLIISAQTKKI